MPQDIFFLYYSECDLDAWKYTKIWRKDSYKLTQNDKQHCGVAIMLSAFVLFF